MTSLGGGIEWLNSEPLGPAERADLQAFHAGGGTRTPDTRIMIPLL